MWDVIGLHSVSRSLGDRTVGKCLLKFILLNILNSARPSLHSSSANQEMPCFYITQSFITIFTRFCHRTVSWAVLMQFIISLRLVLILIFPIANTMLYILCGIISLPQQNHESRLGLWRAVYWRRLFSSRTIGSHRGSVAKATSPGKSAASDDVLLQCDLA